jgi:type IV pilus assembly protein PilE
MLGIAPSTSAQFVSGEGVLVFSESSGRPATIARNATAPHSFSGGASRGFTLIELMIAVAVVAILAMIAIPTYSAQMVKGRRSAAEAALLDIAQREQQYLLDARGYAYSTATLNTTIPVDVSAYYTITIGPSPAPVPPIIFTATATPVAGTAQANDAVLTIDNTGAKTPANLW